jgi:ATP-dependent RNA helicase DDX42
MILYFKANPNAGKAFTQTEEEAAEEIIYDEYGNATKVKKEIDPLPPICHSEIKYPSFQKNFYKPHDDIQNASKNQINKLLAELGIRIAGFQPEKPVSSFGHMGFPDRLLERIRKVGFLEPTPIQSTAIPQILSGRDVIGIAQTGSGKTAGFVWPIIYHVTKQRPLKYGDGPRALIMAPTRELCQQLYAEVRKFAKNYDSIRVGIVFGGVNMYEQGKELKMGVEILVATPGRLIDHVKKGNTELSSCTIICLDEADRMLELGFEPQVRSICNHVRPDKQCLFFSATFKKVIERLANNILNDPVKLTQGQIGQVNENVTQTFKILGQGGQTSLILTNNNYIEQKLQWLLSNIVQLNSVGSLLVFVTRKADCVTVHEELKKSGFKTGVIHGDMHQVRLNSLP